MTTEHDASREGIIARVRGAFQFMGAPSQETLRVAGTDISLFTFVQPPLFADVQLDWREESVFVLVGNLVDGSVPGGYYLDDAGRKVRWHLGAVLSQGGRSANERNLRRVAGETGPSAMLEQIAVMSEELEEALEDLPTLIDVIGRTDGH